MSHYSNAIHQIYHIQLHSNSCLFFHRCFKSQCSVFLLPILNIAFSLSPLVPVRFSNPTRRPVLASLVKKATFDSLIQFRTDHLVVTFRSVDSCRYRFRNRCKHIMIIITFKIVVTRFFVISNIARSITVILIDLKQPIASQSS